MSADPATSQPAAPLRWWKRWSTYVAATGVALVLGWWGWGQSARQQAIAVNSLRYVDDSLDVYYDYQLGEAGPISLQPISDAESSVPRWLLNRQGIDFFHSAVAVHLHGKHRLDVVPLLQRLPSLNRVLVTQHGPFDTELLEKLERELPGVRIVVCSDMYTQHTGIDFKDPSTRKIHPAYIAPDDQPALNTFRGVLMQFWFEAGRVTESRGFETIELAEQRRGVADDDLALLAAFPKLNWADFSETSITDQGLAHLAGIPTLKTLDLTGTLVTDEGLAHLARLPELESLFLEETRITEYGLAHLRSLRKLKVLRIPVVLGDGLEQLAELPNLEELTLGKAWSEWNEALVGDSLAPSLAKLRQLKKLQLPEQMLSPEARAELQKQLPNCAISYADFP